MPLSPTELMTEDRKDLGGTFLGRAIFSEDLMRRGHVPHTGALYFADAGHPRLRSAPATGPRPDASQMSLASEGTSSSLFATSNVQHWTLDHEW